MNEWQNIINALDALDPSRLNYQEWTEVGMALKAEGFPVSVWEDWSRKDLGRYHPGECEKKFDTFQGSGVGGGTIIHYAEMYSGFSPKGKVWDWSDHLPAEVEGYEQIIADNSAGEEPYKMAIKYIKTLFEPGDIVGYVHSALYKEDKNKWVPANSGTWRKYKDLVSDLTKYKNLEIPFGTINEAAGAWIRINPLNGKGASDKNVTAYRYALAEADSMSIEDQKKLLINLKLPIAALVESGGKSVHAVVRVDASSEAEYKQRVDFLFSELAKRNFIVDTNNKNPSRLSRLPGAMRNGKCQKLIATNIGCKSWLDWVDHINGINDDLPPIGDLWEQALKPPELSPELIGGVLREGNKMIITGESKAGKTCLSQELAVCIAEGKPWLNKFKCARGRVLYINLEVEEASLYHRFKSIYEANEWKLTEEGCRNIRPWNLRGHAIPLDRLADQIIRRCRNTGPYKAIILDPLYKVQQGDENSAEAIIKFCNALDKIAHETGAAVIYDHHHPKGSTGDRKVIDRGSGSGVFARDADAICDLSFLDPSKAVLEVIGPQIRTGEKPMQISFVLRDFKDIEPQNCFFKFPIHYLDTANLLAGVPVEGSKEANLQKSPKRTSESDRKGILDRAFDMCEEDGRASLSDMADWCGGEPSKRSLRRYVEEFSDEYKIENGFVIKSDTT